MNKRSILTLVVCMAMVLASCGSSAGSPAQVSQEAGTGQTSGQMKAEESTATENEEAAAENQGAGAENEEVPYGQGHRASFEPLPWHSGTCHLLKQGQGVKDNKNSVQN